MYYSKKFANLCGNFGEHRKKEKNSFWDGFFFAIIVFIVLGAIAG